METTFSVLTTRGTPDQRAVPAQRGHLPGVIRGFLWPTEFLLFSDFLVAKPHAHGALQLSVGLDGMPRVQLDGRWRHTRGVLVDTDVRHGFRCDGCLTAIGWIEGESRTGQQLRRRVLDGRPYAMLDEVLCARVAAALRPVLGASAGCGEAYARWRRALGELAADITPEPRLDRRIAAVLEYLRTGHAAQELEQLADGELLGRFLTDRDEAAFAVLVHHHGPMILGVVAVA